MRSKLLLCMCLMQLVLAPAFSQNLLKQWDSAFVKGQVTISAIDALNSLEGDYAPVLLNSGKLIFTSERVNPKTRESSLAGNQNVYEYDFKSGKVRYSYFYNNDDHTAVAGIAADQKTIFLYRAWNEGDVYVTAGLSGKERYSHFKSIGSPVNSDESQEQSAALWTQWLVFASNRAGGLGGFDLYYGMVDEKMKVYGVLPLEGVNSDSSETDARFMSDGTFLFSSNRSGQYQAYCTRFDGSKWESPQPLSFIPDSFAGSDVRDVVVYDSVFYFSSNRSGNYNIYSGQRPMKVVPVAKPDSVIVIVEDTVPVKPDTIAQLNKFEQKLIDLEQKLDSMEYKPYKAFVQVGAYRLVKTISEFKNRFPAFDTTRLHIENEIMVTSFPDTMHKFIIDQSFSTLRSAAIRQQEALKQQASPINLFASPVDAFIAVYDNRKVRIVIFFNLDKDDYKILVGDKVVYF